MGQTFKVVPSPSRVVVNKDGTGRVQFRIKNTSDQDVEMHGQVVAQKQSLASWFAIEGQAGQPLGRGGSATVIVNVTVPPDTRPGDDYALALELANTAASESQPERSPAVTIDVNAHPERRGRGILATTVGAVIGGVIAFALAIALAAYEIGDGVLYGVHSRWTIGHTLLHIVNSVFLGFIITVLVGLVIPWVGEMLGSGIALRIRHHWGISHTLLILTIATPIWSIGAGIVLIIVYKAVQGNQFILPLVIWLVTLLLVPPIFARLMTVAGRRHAH